MQDPAFLRSCMRLYQGALKPDAPLVTFPSFNQRHLGDPCEAEKPTEGLLVSVFGPWLTPWKAARDVSVCLEHVVYALAREEDCSTQVHWWRCDSSNPVDFSCLTADAGDECAGNARDAVLRSFGKPFAAAGKSRLKVAGHAQYFVLSSFDHLFHGIAHKLVHQQLSHAAGSTLNGRIIHCQDDGLVGPLSPFSDGI